MKSQRTDGRGHWPAGKPRHPDKGWEELRRRLVAFLKDNHKPGVISGRVLAEYLGVWEGAVRFWIKGQNVPSKELQTAIRKWMRLNRAS